MYHGSSFTEPVEVHQPWFDRLTRFSFWILKKIRIPLPPIETQREIVAQIEEEQALVDANRRLIEIFERKIAEKTAGIWGNEIQ